MALWLLRRGKKSMNLSLYVFTHTHALKHIYCLFSDHRLGSLQRLSQQSEVHQWLPSYFGINCQKLVSFHDNSLFTTVPTDIEAAKQMTAEMDDDQLALPSDAYVALVHLCGEFRPLELRRTRIWTKSRSCDGLTAFSTPRQAVHGSPRGKPLPKK